MQNAFDAMGQRPMPPQGGEPMPMPQGGGEAGNPEQIVAQFAPYLVPLIQQVVTQMFGPMMGQEQQEQPPQGDPGQGY